MHMLISFLVKGDNKEDAKSNAESLLQDKVGEGKGFDYYNLGDDSSSRWKAPTVKATSKTGQKRIKEAMKNTKRDFLHYVKEIREMLAKNTNKELFEEKNKTGMFRHYCHCVGMYEGHTQWLYSEEGSAIQTPDSLKSRLDDIKDLWIVSADVHY